ncbi:hypothetical protein CRU87_05010 [Aliarcobacter trophiarum LMG 25534]|uniref:Membrane protein n=1 Tax=Aliarcobacter trophiarum LMG 25534 TaxID=1032241 RepID=A0AAD0QKM9_9BACT|nr:hypothetical protein [Aliarcobacter trophiarum]AXK49390.1 putative membrane protein [Aliarcobacter trophiarum LMG 25534]RXI27865.1 hypothetical protein CRU89_03470 [Aliarcobacter trophiarum]RXJ91995.1 hypothetical protein CRU87_05010 [Aliarcobacter trophiarum LMG 25534]
MEIFSLFFIFIAIEIFESNWQKSNTLYGMLELNYIVFKKNIFLYFILHMSFFFSIYLSITQNNFGFLMSSILALKFFDIVFKLSIMKKLSNGVSLSEIIPFNVNITPLFRYLNVLIYPLLFIFATTL